MTASSNSVSVYTGRTHLGHVVRRGDGFIAINTDGVVIGTYTTQREAVGAFEETAS